MELAVDLGGAALAALAFAIVVLGAGKLLADADSQADEPWASLEGCTRAVDVRTAAIALTICVLVVVTLGTVAAAGDVSAEALRLNREQSIAAYFAAWLLFAAGALALLIGYRDPDSPGRLWWSVLGVALLAIGFDEAAELHERIEVRTGLPAAAPVLPLALLAAVGWWRTLPRMREEPPALPLFAVGVLAWVVAAALDPIHSVEWKSILEETLEMTGSALLLLSLLGLARAATGADRRGPDPRPRAST